MNVNFGPQVEAVTHIDPSNYSYCPAKTCPKRDVCKRGNHQELVNKCNRGQFPVFGYTSEPEWVDGKCPCLLEK